MKQFVLTWFIFASLVKHSFLGKYVIWLDKVLVKDVHFTKFAPRFPCLNTVLESFLYQMLLNSHMVQVSQRCVSQGCVFPALFLDSACMSWHVAIAIDWGMLATYKQLYSYIVSS